jgi:hypothetical protein
LSDSKLIGGKAEHKEDTALPWYYWVSAFFGPLLTFSILVGNIWVLQSYNSDPTLFFSLTNNVTNLPTGLFTAMFAPDTTAFGGPQAFMGWALPTFVALFGYLAAFVMVNLDEERELALRLGFYGLALILVTVLSNAFSLVRGLATVGPSTASMTAIGLVLGFGVSNSVKWIKEGTPRLKGRYGFATMISLTAVGALVLVMLASPADFFLMAKGVDWVSHVFCFVVGTLIALPVGLRRR